MPLGQDDIRFRATFDDQVSPAADRLEQRLRELGASDYEIKMMLRAYDEATPKLKEARKHVDALPKEHRISIMADTSNAVAAIEGLRRNAEQKTKFGLNDELLDTTSHLKNITDQLFTIRSMTAIPGGIPGLPGLRAFGAGAGITGILGAAGSAISQGVQINSSMEQSMVTLTQTLKDNTKAQAEMGKLVQTAQTTPFNYQDVLQADVRLRSYNIPTQQGEGGPNNQGWLKSAGDMAAALNTPITQAVEAIADARQGYFVRMMSYGIRMMREDFQAGGKYAGLTYEQGLERAINRFQGAQEAQSKTFKGVMSNMQDIMQNRILMPIGAPVFNQLRQSAVAMQDRMIGNSPQAYQFQQNLGREVEKVQHGMVQVFDLVQRGKQYFDDNLKQPLMDFAKQVVHVGVVFVSDFVKPLSLAFKTIASVITAIARPIAEFVSHHDKLIQVVATFKALSLLGFSGPAKGLQDISGGLNILHPSLFRVIGGLRELGSGTIKVGIAALTASFISAARASDELKTSLRNSGDTGLKKFKELNAEIAKTSFGLNISSTALKGLTSDALNHLEGGGPYVALHQAQTSQALQRDYGIDRNLANRIMDSMNINKDSDVDKAAISIRGLNQVTKELHGSMSDAVRVMQQFASKAEPIGLGGPAGGSMLYALSKATHTNNFLTQQDFGRGIYSGDAFMDQMMQGFHQPSVDALQRLQNAGRPLHDFFGFNRGAFNQIRNASVISGPASTSPTDIFKTSAQIQGVRDTTDTLRRNVTNQQQQQDYVTNLAGRAKVPQQLRDQINIPNYTNPAFAKDMPDLDKIISGSKNAEQAAEGLAHAWTQNERNLSDLNKTIDGYNNKINSLNQTVNTLSLAQQAVGMVVEKFNHDQLLPMQKHIEDAQFAMQKYSQSALRPLERDMQRLGNESARMGNSMSNAQYAMSKWTDGLLSGEQAALNQLHALERYNRQLSMLQLSYTQIGAQLGQTTFDEGARVRVEPLANITIQAQMERAQRRQQLAQLRYEGTYGEQHYQMQQAARTQFQRQELPFAQRMSGIRQNVSVIDDTARAQHNLENQQFGLQDKMAKVNENIADQQDKLTRLQIALTNKQLHGGLRELNEMQYRIGRRTERANIALTKQQILVAAAQEHMNDLRSAGQTISTLFQQLLDFDSGGPVNTLGRMVEFAQAVGGATDKQAATMRQYMHKAETALAKAGGEPVRSDSRWQDIIKEGVKGAFTGDTWRRLTAMLGINGPAGGVLAAGATAGTIAYTGFVGLGLGRVGLRRGVGRLGARALPGIAGRAVGAWGKRGRTWREAFQAVRSFRGFAGGALGGAVGGLLGAPFGLSPLTSLGGAWLGSRTGENNTIREMIKAVASGVRAGGKGIQSGAKGIEKAGGVYRKGASELRDVAAKARQSGIIIVDKHGQVIDEFKSAGTKFGDHVKDFRKGSAKIDKAAGVIEDSASGLKGFLKEHFPRAAHAAKEGRTAVRDSMSAAKAAREAAKGTEGAVKEAAKGSSRVTRTAARAVSIAEHPGAQVARKVAGRVGGAAWFLPAALDFFHGNVNRGSTELLNTLSYMGPLSGPRTALDAMLMGSHFGGKLINADNPAITDPRSNELIRNAIGGATGANQFFQGSSIQARRNPNFDDSERRWLGAQQQRIQDLGLEITERAKHGQDVKKQLDQLAKMEGDYTSAYEKFAQDRVDRVAEVETKAYQARLDDQDKFHGKAQAAVAANAELQNKIQDNGFNRMRSLTTDHLDAIIKKIKKFKADLGLSDTQNDTETAIDAGLVAGPAAPTRANGGGFEFGGKVIKGKGDGRGKLYWAGEEDDELVIPLAGHRRDRAKSLVKQAAGIVGLANGGFIPDGGTDRAYTAAKSVYAQAAQHFADGGRIVPIQGEGGNGTPMGTEYINSRIKPLVEKLIRQYHLLITDAYDPTGSKHKSPGHEVTGTAVDFVPGRGGSWPLLEKMGRWAVGQGLIVGYDSHIKGAQLWPDHGRGNHIHIEFGGGGGGPVDSKDLQKLVATAGNIPIPHLPGVPQGLKNMGAVGPLVFKALKKIQKRITASSSSALQDAGHYKGKLDRVFPAKYIDEAHATLSAKQVRELATKAGLPSWFERIAKGESGYGPGVVQRDPGDGMVGYGLWQITPHAWGATSAAYKRMQELGGIEAMRNPWRNAQMAKYLYDHASSKTPNTPGFPWYGTKFLAAGGSWQVTKPQEAFVAHMGEKVTVQQPAQRVAAASAIDDTRQRNIIHTIQEISAEIKRARYELQHANDREDKKKDSDHLKELNAELKKQWGQLRSPQAMNKDISRVIKGMGDTSGGENTTALVIHETKEATKEITKAVNTYIKSPAGKRDTRAVRTQAKRRDRVTHAARGRHSQGGTRVTRREHTAIKATQRATRSAKRVVTAGKRVARARGTRNYAVSAAKRGVNRRVVEQAVGHRLTGKERTAYEAAAKRKGGPSKSDLDKLRKSFGSDIAKLSKSYSKAHTQARQDSKAATKAIRAAGLSTHKAVHSAADKHIAVTSQVKDNVKAAGEKGRVATEKVHAQTKEGTSTAKKADNKRDRAEAAQDKREREHFKNVEQLLNTIAAKDLSVNVHNQAKGAQLTTTIVQTRRRSR